MITHRIPRRVIFVSLMVAPSLTLFAAESAAAQPQSSAEYVGAAVCKQCHEKEFTAWTGSHHQLAMQRANTSTVLRDFDNAKFSHYGVESTFFKRDDAFSVPFKDGVAEVLAMVTLSARPLEDRVAMAMIPRAKA